MKTRVTDYIKNKKNNPIGEYKIGNINVYVKEPLPENIDLQRCLDYIFKYLPKIFYENVEMIMIGNFPFLQQRKVDALYESGAIYISNKQNSEADLISDVVHEISHSYEENNSEEIYSDGKVESEFLAKRYQLFNILKGRNLISSFPSQQEFANTEYNVEFDDYLYNTVGYPILTSLVMGLFVSPYGATSLKEYFANAFEEFFVNDVNVVKKISPSVYNKLINHVEL